jgi:hypothetical protein
MLQKIRGALTDRRNSLFTSYVMLLDRMGMEDRVLRAVRSVAHYQRIQVDQEPFLIYLLLRRKNLPFFKKFVEKAKFGNTAMTDSQNIHNLSPLAICLLQDYELPTRPDYDY